MKQIKDIILETKKIKWVDILDLQPIDLKNDYHSEKTKESIIENGFSRAIYVWLNPDDQQTYIIDGHLRTDLLKELVNDGYDVPDMLNCTFLDLPNKQTAIKYLLQVFNQKTNPISQKALGDWFDQLDLSIPELNLQIDDLHIELDDIPLITETQGDDDVTESAPPITRRGDIYELGGVHRVMCGDSTSIDDVEKLMDCDKADISFTSPPYNAGKSELLSGNTHTGDNKYNSYNDNQTSENYLDLLVSFTEYALLNSEYLICNIQSLAGNKIALIDYINHFKNNIIDVAIWDKGHAAPAMAVNVMNSVWEYLIFISSKDQPSRAIPNANFRGTVPNIFRRNPQRNNEFSKIHAATFPIELCEWALQFTNEKNIILDLFLGSGSTLIACEKLNRKCYGMELDEKYCDVIVQRYVDFCKKNKREYSVFLNGKVCKEFESD